MKKPEEWFELIAAEENGRYGMVFMPILDKGVERFRMAYQLRNGLPLPADAPTRILFRPLHFISSPQHIFGQISSKLGKKVRVLLLDPKHFSPDLSKTDFDKHAIVLGEFSYRLKANFISDLLKEGQN